MLARRPGRLPRDLAIALVALVAAMAVAAAVGLDPVYAWTGTPERRFGVATWVLCALALAARSALAPQQVDRDGDRGDGGTDVSSDLAASEWEAVELPDGLRASSLAAAGGTLYALGTAPGGGGRDLVVAASADGAAFRPGRTGVTGPDRL